MPLICKVIRVWKKKTDEFKFEFEDWWEFDGLGEEFCCQIGWSDRKKVELWRCWLIEVVRQDIDWGDFFEELRLRSIRDQEVRRLLVRHQTMGRLFGVWECWWRWWSLGFLGLRKKKEADEKKMKLILSTIHLTQVAFLEENSLVRMTSLIMYSRWEAGK